ncbi:hypothetical protein BE21_12315 [Sorangium cellulosum]|uniref:Uncharacterized protein n=1 Tax=Sorangium cellulosum TaxID=56 RepID=A0A150U099_SORCE|nr:hypothetical protein BE21_12315 [Sorangium cellulosum]
MTTIVSRLQQCPNHPEDVHRMHDPETAAPARGSRASRSRSGARGTRAGRRRLPGLFVLGAIATIRLVVVSSC